MTRLGLDESAPPRTLSATGVADRLGRRGSVLPLEHFPAEEGLGFWLVITGLLLSCFAGHWSDMGVPVPIDRGLLLLGLTFEWRRAAERRVGPTVGAGTVVLLVATAMWAGCSFLGAPQRPTVGVFFLIDLLVLPALLFVSAPVLFSTDRRRFLLTASFTLFGIYLGATAITQTLGLTGLVFPSYILDPSVGIHIDRARGPYVEASNNGIMLIFSGTFGAMLAVGARRRLWRVLGGICVALTLIGCALTLTRAIWFAGGAAALIAIIAVPGLRRRIPLVLALFAAIGVLFLAAFPDFLVAATARGGDQNPIWDRLNVNSAAVRMLLQNPLFGVGWNQAGFRMTEFIRLGADYPVTAASAGLIPHNLFITRFAELGIIGGSLWAGSLVAAVVLPIVQPGRADLLPWRVALLAMFAAWAIVGNTGPLNYSEPAYLLLLVSGIIAAGRRTGAPYDWRPRARQRTTAGTVHG